MIKWFSALLFLLSFSLYAQGVECSMAGEGNVNSVVLRWDPLVWSAEVEGVAIKRREVSENGNVGSWVDLHQGLIVQELKLDHAFEKSVSSTEEQNRLKSKLSTLIAEGKAKEYTASEYYTIALSNPNKIKVTRIGFIVDYDLALLQGFGLVDKQIPPGYRYEYGLFIKLKKQALSTAPLSTFIWKYGTRPDLNIVGQSKAKRNNKTTLDLNWYFDSETLKDKGISAFNVYQEKSGWKKLNAAPMLLSISQKKAVLNYTVRVDENFVSGEFKAVPVSVFGTEGSPVELVVDEINHPQAKLELTLVPKPKEGIVSFTWSWANEVKLNVKQVDLESQNWNELKFSKVESFFLDAGRGEVLVNESTTKKVYRIAVKQPDGEILYSNEVVLENYTPILLPAPVGLSAIFDKNTSSIKFSWNAIKQNKTIVQYRVYIGSYRDESVVLDLSIPLQQNTQFDKKVSAADAGIWKFAVVAVVNGAEGERSETVEVMVPSTKISAVNNRKVVQLGNKASIQWSYSNELVPDLLGYRIYLNDVTVADEKQLSKTSSSWISSELETGKQYIYKISSVTTSGLESEKREMLLNVK